MDLSNEGTCAPGQQRAKGSGNGILEQLAPHQTAAPLRIKEEAPPLCKEAQEIDSPRQNEGALLR